MRHYKKRTIALVLASVVTVVGAFGAENYKNSLMAIKFIPNSAGYMNVRVLTKSDYNNDITTVKKDANTYVIMLPEMSSEMKSEPKLEGSIESVEVNTLPYTTEKKGYTKITIKTTSNITLITTKDVFVPEKEKQEAIAQKETPDTSVPAQEKQESHLASVSHPKSNDNYDPFKSLGPAKTATKTEVKEPEHSNEVQNETYVITDTSSNNNESQSISSNIPNDNYSEQDESYEKLYLLLGTLFVLITSVYFFIKARNKMSDIIGEQQSFDIDDKADKNTPKNNAKTSSIKNTISNIDKRYKNPAIMPTRWEDTNVSSSNIIDSEEGINEQEVVDLDALFQQQKSVDNETVAEINEEENDALDDFLNDFMDSEKQAQDEQNHLAEIAESDKHNDEIFNQLLGNKNISFTKDDIEEINKLLNCEISDEAIENIGKYTASEEIITPDEENDIITNSDKLPQENERHEFVEIENISKEDDIIRERLERLLADYQIDQNIIFNSKDVEAIRKLMSVELDEDFVKNLKTNSKRTEEMTWEMLNRDVKTHNTTEIITLNVQKDLPNLSEELKKYKNKEIVSDRAPEVIYYDKSYEVSTIPVDDALKNISFDSYKKEIEKPLELKNSKPDSDTPIVAAKKINTEFTKQKTDAVQNKNRVQKNVQNTAESKVTQQNITKPSTDPAVKQKVARGKHPREYTIDGIKYNIIAIAPFTDKIGCYLSTSEQEGYSILGYVGTKIFKIKHYEKLNNSKLQTRMSEKLSDGSVRYIVRIGIHKFILEVSDNKLEYVMDLC